jgi:hypothetical protein
LVHWHGEHLYPYRMTGGPDRDNPIGWDQFLLVVFLFIYPEAQEDEIVMYIYESGEGNVYSRSVVFSHLREMKLLSKKASTEAYQGFTLAQGISCKRSSFLQEACPSASFKCPRGH